MIVDLQRQYNIWLKDKRRSRKAEDVSGPSCMEKFSFQLNVGVANLGTAGAVFIGKDETVICVHGARAFALSPAIVANLSA